MNNKQLETDKHLDFTDKVWGLGFEDQLAKQRDATIC